MLAAQPFSVEELGTGELHANSGASEPLDRLPVQAIGGLVLAEQRARAGLNTERPVRAAGRRPLRKPAERNVPDLSLSAPSRRLDQLNQPPLRDHVALTSSAARWAAASASS